MKKKVSKFHSLYYIFHPTALFWTTATISRPKQLQFQDQNSYDFKTKTAMISRQKQQ